MSLMFLASLIKETNGMLGEEKRGVISPGAHLAQPLLSGHAWESVEKKWGLGCLIKR